ncbi:MAG: SMI1/KNR4 family protein [Faecalibacterium sp.]|nr:SMI1/KNR4 family protein [Ruminococcus sp.]MCM1391355.1 SMI1/KNR4 family protein [Ruminococcus sp.]MCM1484914.1 SMI1/KNR4 family protein [Faecalibacterium sp.]
MCFKDYIKNINVDFSADKINIDDIPIIEIFIGLKFGDQLKEYILNYGYLGYEYIELFGINNRLGTRSNMVKQTRYLHKYFSETKNLIALEDQGDGDYYLVDSNDYVFRFLSSGNELIPTKMKLFDYIKHRFNSVTTGGI